MWLGNQILARFEKLHRAGFECSFEQGEQVARGYADLGYEQFLVLSDHKLLSLQSGKSSELQEGHRHFFFSVPSVEQLADVLARRFIMIEAIYPVGQTRWGIRFKCAEGERQEIEDRSLLGVLCEALIMVLEKRC
jgi:hypothetical protein